MPEPILGCRPASAPRLPWRSAVLACLLLLLPATAAASTELLAGIVIAVDPDGRRVTVRVTRNIDSSGDIDVGSVRSLKWDPGAVFVLDGHRVAPATLFAIGQHVLCYPKDDGFFFGNSDERAAVGGFVISVDDDAGQVVLQQADADAESRVTVELDPAASWLLDRQPSTRAEALRANAQLLVLPPRPLQIRVLSGSQTLPPLAEAHAHSLGGRPVLADDQCVVHPDGGEPVAFGLHKATCFLDTDRVAVAELVADQPRVYAWCTRKRDYPNFLVGVADPAAHVDGVIASVTGDELTVTTSTGPVTLSGLQTAAVTLDEEPSDASALVAGRQVRILRPRPQQIEVTSCPTAAATLSELTQTATAGEATARGQAIRLLYRRGIPLAEALPLLASVADDQEAEVVEGCLWTLSHYPVPTDSAERAQVIAILDRLIQHGRIETIKGDGYCTTGDLGLSVRYLQQLVSELGSDAARLEGSLQGLLERLGESGRKRDLAKALRKATGQ